MTWRDVIQNVVILAAVCGLYYLSRSWWSLVPLLFALVPGEQKCSCKKDDKG